MSKQLRSILNLSNYMRMVILVIIQTRRENRYNYSKLCFVELFGCMWGSGARTRLWDAILSDGHFRDLVYKSFFGCAHALFGVRHLPKSRTLLKSSFPKSRKIFVEIEKSFVKSRKFPLKSRDPFYVQHDQQSPSSAVSCLLFLQY